MQGKVKSIDWIRMDKHYLSIGEQVVYNNKVYKIAERVSTLYRLEGLNNLGILIDGDRLKQLVVEYKGDQLPFTNEENYYSKYTIPLKFGQWQSAINNGEVDSDQVIEFVKLHKYFSIDNFKTATDFYYAKIIPANKKMYTEEEVKELCLKGMNIVTKAHKVATIINIDTWWEQNK